MILSGKKIASKTGNDIIIDPFDKAKLNPNGYNLSLRDEFSQVFYPKILNPQDLMTG